MIVPEQGCQCLGYSVGGLAVIAGPVNAEALRAHPFGSGVALLFPWPGRIANGRFSYARDEYQVPINEPGRGHALHGLTYNREFTVVRRGPYYVRTQFDSRTAGDFGDLWPWPFVLEIDHEIGNGLRIKMTVRNTGDRPMPFGFGAHPYFHLPLGGRGSRADTILELDADGHWPLDSTLIPERPPEPLAGKFDLRRGRELGADTYDDAFQMSHPAAPGRARARLVDRSARIVIEVHADDAFGQFVVYAPLDRDVIAIEPYTAAPDAFNLAARGIDSGARTLAPGASFAAGFEIRISAP